MKQLLVIQKIKVQDANAFASSYSVGFPSIPAFLGSTHKLERILKDKYSELKFNGVGIVSHEFNLKGHRNSKYEKFSVVANRFPLNKKGKSNSFIEEPHCDLTVSLVVEINGITRNEDEFIFDVENCLRSCIKLASGDIISFKKPNLIGLDENDDNEVKRVFKTLMPGYALIERRDLISECMKKDSSSALDTLLSFLEIRSKAEYDDNKNVVWSSSRKESGWLVPISVGYVGISNLGKIKNQRNPEVLHRFAESIITLGEFVMPYRLNKLSDLFWHYYYEEENNLYVCTQDIK